MKEIMQFSSTKERLKYLSGGFEEVTPKVVTPKPVKVAESADELIEIPEEEVKVEEKKTEEKPKKKSPAKKKTSKKGKKDGEVQAE